MGARCGACDPCAEEELALPVLEQQPAVWEKVEVGLCLSGGGLAAFCSAVGALRALESLGLAQFTHLSCVGGSAWAAAAYVFGDASAHHLLGSGCEPESLTLEVLDASPAPLLRCATRKAP